MHHPLILRLTGSLLGVGLLLAGLVVWHLTIDAAGFFGPSWAIAGTLALWMAGRLHRRKATTLVTAARVLGGGAVIIACCAALSLGAFLPPIMEIWVSPVLGRFGGAAAFGWLALAASITAYDQVTATERWRYAHIATLFGLAASWVWGQTGRQISFPPPPTTVQTITPALNFLLLSSWLLTLLIFILTYRARRTAQQAPPWYHRWCLHWASISALLGLSVGIILRSPVAFWSIPPLLLTVASTAAAFWGSPHWPLLKRWGANIGWVGLTLLACGLLYCTTTEDLEIVLARNTVEYRVRAFWQATLPTLATAPTSPGSISGLVTAADGTPLRDAQVVIATPTGAVFSASSDQGGRYQITDIPAGNYLPLATSHGYHDAGRSGLAGRVATVRPGQTATQVDFTLPPQASLQIPETAELQLDSPTITAIAGLSNSATIRRSFTVQDQGTTISGGLIHEPAPEQGTGPFPIIFIVYPGPTHQWEGVSAPLAAQGFVVISYFPQRQLDFNGDLHDLELLLQLIATGRLTTRGNPTQIALAGGSASTVYTYLLAQQIAGTPTARNVRAMVQYGGLFDLYHFRQRWTQGAVTIDPGISELEYLLIAFGRPDTRPEIYLRFSPHYRLQHASLPPTLLVHAERDIIVPPDQSRLAAMQLAQLNIPHQLLLYPELEHYLDISKHDPAQFAMLDQTVAFLHQWFNTR